MPNPLLRRLHACLSACCAVTLAPVVVAQTLSSPISLESNPAVPPSAAASPAAAGDGTTAASDQPSTLSVTARNGLISVKADNAPLREVVEHIGQALDIPVESHISAEHRVSDQFQDLALEDTLKRLGANYAYIGGDSGNAKIVLFPTGQAVPPQSETPAAAAGGTAAEGKPFQFDLDPAEAPEEKDHEEH